MNTSTNDTPHSRRNNNQQNEKKRFTAAKCKPFKFPLLSQIQSPSAKGNTKGQKVRQSNEMRINKQNFAIDNHQQTCVSNCGENAHIFVHCQGIQTATAIKEPWNDNYAARMPKCFTGRQPEASFELANSVGRSAMNLSSWFLIKKAHNNSCEYCPSNVVKFINDCIKGRKTPKGRQELQKQMAKANNEAFVEAGSYETVDSFSVEVAMIQNQSFQVTKGINGVF